jgi:hypothetical protein
LFIGGAPALQMPAVQMSPSQQAPLPSAQTPPSPAQLLAAVRVGWRESDDAQNPAPAPTAQSAIRAEIRKRRRDRMDTGIVAKVRAGAIYPTTCGTPGKAEKRPRAR